MIEVHIRFAYSDIPENVNVIAQISYKTFAEF